MTTTDLPPASHGRRSARVRQACPESNGDQPAPFVHTAPVQYVATGPTRNPSADRRLRIPLRLRDNVFDLLERFSRVDVCATAGFAQCVRCHPGSFGRAFPVGPVWGVGAGGAPVSAGRLDPGDDLADPYRLVGSCAMRS
jgi:hypothetical protein